VKIDVKKKKRKNSHWLKFHPLYNPPDNKESSADIGSPPRSSPVAAAAAPVSRIGFN
jgi:hypothetical protein